MTRSQRLRLYTFWEAVSEDAGTSGRTWVGPVGKAEETTRRLGVRHVVIPWTGNLSAARRAVEQDRGWRRRYR